MSQQNEIQTPDEFFVHALAIESEAAERYHVLADQMRVHHNSACARLFEHLAALEEEHTAGLHRKYKGVDLSQVAPWSLHWSDLESPESTPLDHAHYLMTAHHALTEALNGERRAKEFFEHAAKHSLNSEVRALAHQFAAEEQRHIEMIGLMIRPVPEPDPNWAQDFDKPVEPE